MHQEVASTSKINGFKTSAHMTFAPSHCIASHKGRGSGIIWGGGSNPDNAWMYIKFKSKPHFYTQRDFSTEYCHDLPPKLMCKPTIVDGDILDTAGAKILGNQTFGKDRNSRIDMEGGEPTKNGRKRNRLVRRSLIRSLPFWWRQMLLCVYIC